MPIEYTHPPLLHLRLFFTDVQRGIKDISPTGIPLCQLPLNLISTLLLTALTGPSTSAEFRLSHRVRTYDMERARDFDKHRIPDRRRTQVLTWSVAWHLYLTLLP